MDGDRRYALPTRCPGGKLDPALALALGIVKALAASPPTSTIDRLDPCQKRKSFEPTHPSKGHESIGLPAASRIRASSLDTRRRHDGVVELGPRRSLA